MHSSTDSKDWLLEQALEMDCLCICCASHGDKASNPMTLLTPARG